MIMERLKGAKNGAATPDRGSIDSYYPAHHRVHFVFLTLS